jgi:regulator of sigma E protease
MSAFFIVAFVVSIIFAIVLHEAGHFVTAKAFGMRADRFFVGFGPTIWSTRRGETEYGVKAFLLGGFVRIRGMSQLDERLGPVADDVFAPDALTEDRQRAAEETGSDPLAVGNLPEPTWERLTVAMQERGCSRAQADDLVAQTQARLAEHPTANEARATLTQLIEAQVPPTERRGDLRHRLLKGDEGRFYADRPAWQRTIVLLAGSATHFVIAVVVLFAMFVLFPTVVMTPVVDEVLPDMPATEAGLQPGDRVVAVDGVRSDDYLRLRDAIRERPGQEITLVVERAGQEITLALTPQLAEDPQTGEPIGQVGFAPTIEERQLRLGEAVRATFVGEIGFVTQVTMTFEAIGRVFGPEGLASIFRQTTGEAERTTDGAISLVGAAGLAGQAADFGPILLFMLIASINIFIGVFNLLPLPPLDGGHLAVLAVERSVNGVRKLRGRTPDFQVDPRAIAAIAVPVLMILGFVFFSLLFLDITDPIRI